MPFDITDKKNYLSFVLSSDKKGDLHKPGSEMFACLLSPKSVKGRKIKCKFETNRKSLNYLHRKKLKPRGKQKFKGIVNKDFVIYLEMFLNGCKMNGMKVIMVLQMMAVGGARYEGVLLIIIPIIVCFAVDFGILMHLFCVLRDVYQVNL